MTKFIQINLIAIVFSCTAIKTMAQKPADSTSAKKPVAYEKVITAKVKSQHGMFTIHQLDDS